jgi:hypothetical protein
MNMCGRDILYKMQKEKEKEKESPNTEVRAIS